MPKCDFNKIAKESCSILDHLGTYAFKGYKLNDYTDWFNKK